MFLNCLCCNVEEDGPDLPHPCNKEASQEGMHQQTHDCKGEGVPVCLADIPPTEVVFKGCRPWDAAARLDFRDRSEIVANGSFGAVSFAFAKWMDDRPVALKSLILADDKEVAAARCEVTHLRALCHENVVSLLATYYQPEMRVETESYSRAILVFPRLLVLESVVMQPIGEARRLNEIAAATPLCIPLTEFCFCSQMLHSAMVLQVSMLMPIPWRAWLRGGTGRTFARHAPGTGPHTLTPHIAPRRQARQHIGILGGHFRCITFV